MTRVCQDRRPQGRETARLARRAPRPAASRSTYAPRHGGPEGHLRTSLGAQGYSVARADGAAYAGSMVGTRRAIALLILGFYITQLAMTAWLGPDELFACYFGISKYAAATGFTFKRRQSDMISFITAWLVPTLAMNERSIFRLVTG